MDSSCANLLILNSRKRHWLTVLALHPSQLNRYLASPGNWTIGIIQRLLAGISAEEAFLRSEPLLGRTPQNRNVLDLLDEQPETIDQQPLTGGTAELIRIEMR